MRSNDGLNLLHRCESPNRIRPKTTRMQFECGTRILRVIRGRDARATFAKTRKSRARLAHAELRSRRRVEGGRWLDRHSRGPACGRDHVFRVGRNAMLMQIEPVGLAFCTYPQ